MDSNTVYPTAGLGVGLGLTHIPAAKKDMPLTAFAVDELVTLSNRLSDLQGNLYQLHARLVGEPERGPSGQPTAGDTGTADQAIRYQMERAKEALSAAESFCAQLSQRL